MNDYLASADPANTDLYAKPRDRQHLGGMSLGGPLKANRTFYFASFEEYRQTRHATRPLRSHRADGGVPRWRLQRAARHQHCGLASMRLAIRSIAARSSIRGPASSFPATSSPRPAFSPVSRQSRTLYRQSYQPMVADRLSNNAAGPAYVDPSFTQHQFSVKADHTLTNDARLSGSLIWTKRPRTLADQGGVWDPGDEMGGPLGEVAQARGHDLPGAPRSQPGDLAARCFTSAPSTYNRFRNPSTTGSSGGDWPQAARPRRARRLRQLPADQLRRRHQRHRRHRHRLRHQQLLRGQRLSVQRQRERG